MSTSDIVESVRLSGFFMAVVSDVGVSSGGISLAGVKFLGVFSEFMVASRINIVLILKPLKTIVLRLRGLFLRLGVQTRVGLYM